MTRVEPVGPMTDALAYLPAARVLLVTPPEEPSYWLERDLQAKPRDLTNLPVAQVVAAPQSMRSVAQTGVAAAV